MKHNPATSAPLLDITLRILTAPNLFASVRARSETRQITLRRTLSQPNAGPAGYSAAGPDLWVCRQESKGTRPSCAGCSPPRCEGRRQHASFRFHMLGWAHHFMVHLVLWGRSRATGPRPATAPQWAVPTACLSCGPPSDPHDPPCSLGNNRPGGLEVLALEVRAGGSKRKAALAAEERAVEHLVAAWGRGQRETGGARRGSSPSSV